MKKILSTFILLAISYFLFSPASALAIDSGCCKFIQWDADKSIFNIQTFPAADSDKCLDSCSKLSNCQNYYSANTPTDVANKNCIADSSGCCSITYVNGSEGRDYDLVYNANSTAECDYYASRFLSVKKKAFTQGLAANSTANACIPVKPKSAGGGCCKRVHWGDLGLDRIEVFNLANSDECSDTCKDLSSFSSTEKCQNFFVAGATPDTINKSCKSASSGCCQISFTPDERISESVTKGKLAYSANSSTDCAHYCFKRQDCKVVSFQIGQQANGSSGLCVNDPAASKDAPTGPGVINTGAGVNPLFQFTIPSDPLKYAAYNPATVIAKVISVLLSILGTIALLMFIYAGFNWMTAMGNDTKVKKAKDIMFWSTAGLVIIFISYIAAGFILELVGVI